MNPRPDGEGLELRIRELEALSPIIDLAIALGQKALAEAHAAEVATDLNEQWRLLGRSTAFTEASKEISALVRSYQ